MTSKTTSEQLESLIKAIIKDWTYPGGQELTIEERQELVNQLKEAARDSNNINEARIITDAFYKDKVVKHFRLLDTNFSWIFEILQHELVSASRLHKLLLDIAHEEHFSEEGIKKINHYFAKSSDDGNNDNFITMSSMDLIDSIGRAKAFQVNKNDDNGDNTTSTQQKVVMKQSKSNNYPHVKKANIAAKQPGDNNSRLNKTKTHSNNIINLKDY